MSMRVCVCVCVRVWPCINMDLGWCGYKWTVLSTGVNTPKIYLLLRYHPSGHIGKWPVMHAATFCWHCEYDCALITELTSSACKSPLTNSMLWMCQTTWVIWFAWSMPRIRPSPNSSTSSLSNFRQARHCCFLLTNSNMATYIFFNSNDVHADRAGKWDLITGVHSKFVEARSTGRCELMH